MFRQGVYKILLTLFLVVIPGCGDVQLRTISTGTQLESASAGEFVSTLKPPINANNQMRVLFFIDQSYSMIHGKCPTDLDGPTPAQSGVGCSSPKPGIDPEGHRFEVIKKWITEIEKSNPEAKVALYPFSGGMNERPRRYPYNQTPIKDGLEYYKFLNLDDAKVRLGDLREEQRLDLLKDTKIDEGDFTGAAPTYMGTTIPLPTLILARDKVFEEMDTLQKKGSLFSTQFRFIYLSDGVFTPTPDLMDKALSAAGGSCSKKCLLDPRVVSCDRGWASMNGKGWSSLTPAEQSAWPRECGYPGPNGYIDSCYCLNVGNDLYQAMGDPEDNRLDKLLSTLGEIRGLPKSFGEGKVRMDFVKIHPERVQSDDMDPPNTFPAIKNIFDEMYKKFGDTQLSGIIDETPPFSILSSSAAHFTFQLESFYVVNLNAIVDENGSVVADSDGDGLSDSAEARLETNPLNPRTPDADGKIWCLDSIEKKYGCRKTSCSPDLDSDNDGLNECEELTLQTDAYSKDNGSDGILDFLKVTRGLNPSQDSRVQDSNADGTSDVQAFNSGVHPMAKFSAIGDDQKIRFRTKFRGYVQSKDAGGQPIQTAQYSIFVDHIPLVATKATERGSELYYSKLKSAATRIPPQLLVGSSVHGKNINEILMLGKVRALQDPEKSYWIFAKKKIQATGEKVHFSIDFSDFKEMPGK